MDARNHPEPPRRGATKVKVLVAFEDARGAYGEAIARASSELRPALEARQAPLAELERGGFDPRVVVCSETDSGHPGGRGVWVQVPTDDGADADRRLARLCLEGERWDTEGPTLAEILDVVDQTGRRLRERGLVGTCRGAPTPPIRRSAWRNCLKSLGAACCVAFQTVEEPFLGLRHAPYIDQINACAPLKALFRQFRRIILGSLHGRGPVDVLLGRCIIPGPFRRVPPKNGQGRVTRTSEGAGIIRE